MELFKTYQVATDYRDHRTPLAWESRQFAEVVFIDKTHDATKPLVYQLKDTYASLEAIMRTSKFHPTSFSHEAFVLLGDSISIDRKKKQILLSNKNTINYLHLVIVSGAKPLLALDNEELISALQALCDALRVKPKIPQSFASVANQPSSYAHTAKPSPEKAAQVDPSSSQTIEKVAHPFMTASLSQGITLELSTLNKRLYEVQL